jgi:hypothetical protein
MCRCLRSTRTSTEHAYRNMTCTPRIENVAARVEEGGAPELLDDIATPSSARAPGFPPPDAPPGYLTHIAIEKVGGVGPWST